MNAKSDNSSNFENLTERVMAVKRAHEDELLGKANVVGVGIGYRRIAGASTSDLALVVMVSSKLPPAQLSAADFIPATIDGVPVDVQEVGEITAY
jgi:hypothetical protein